MNTTHNLSSTTCWNLHKIQQTDQLQQQQQEQEEQEHHRHIIPMASLIWPTNNYLHQTMPSPSAPCSPIMTAPSGFLGDILGLHAEAGEGEEEEEELGAMKEMMYKMAAMQPVDIDPSTVRKPKRRNVRISDDPQSVAARHRRERISEKIRILQRLVPGGTKMDTASMLDEAIRYVKFLKRQIKLLQQPPPHSIAAATDLLRLSPPPASDIIWPFAPTAAPAPAPAASSSSSMSMSMSMDVLAGLGFGPVR